MTVPLASRSRRARCPRAAGRSGSTSTARAARRSISSTTARARRPTARPHAGEGPGASSRGAASRPPRASLPINHERLPGARSYDYLNLNNLAAFPYTFQQGVFEQRLLLDALLDRDPGRCSQLRRLVAAASHFDAAKLVAGGHSMGGMYTNMIGAIEPRYGALTPFGAGGFWNMMILDTAIIPGSRDLLAAVLGVDGDTLTFVHPAIGLIELGWEIADPVNSMARIARRPLAGFPARHIYEPIGLDDKYFPNADLRRGGARVRQPAGGRRWCGPARRTRSRADSLDGLLSYPVRRTDDGTDRASSCSTPMAASSTRTRSIGSSTR